MTRNDISNSIAKMLLEEDISPLTSAVDYYNYWTQKESVIISDPDVAVWTLKLLRSLLVTDRKLLTRFIDD